MVDLCIIDARVDGVEGRAYAGVTTTDGILPRRDSAVLDRQPSRQRPPGSATVADIPLARSLVLEAQEYLGVVVEDLVDVLGRQAKLARSRQKLQARLAEIQARHQGEDTHVSDHGGS
jgi:hypothetical protein